MSMNISVVTLISLLMLAGSGTARAQSPLIPGSHSGIYSDDAARLHYVTLKGDTLHQKEYEAEYLLGSLRHGMKGTTDGIEFDFHDPELKGRLYYGFINSTDTQKHPYPIFFKRSSEIDSGRCSIDIRNRMGGLYDFIGWTETGIIRMGYRVTDAEGHFLYDGKIMVSGTGPFEIDTSIVEGPFVNLLTHHSVVISFETNFKTTCNVVVDNQLFADSEAGTHHEISLNGHAADTEHSYTIYCGGHSEKYGFRTAPKPGSRLPFTFAYASDGRGNAGGGERHILGVNGYMMKRIAALCGSKNTRFIQFTGDLINGYETDKEQIMLEYANWKRTVEPFASYFPFIAGFGNHEALLRYFSDGERGASIDRFPYETESAEAIFARNFVNPRNGPESEDGSIYDPNRDADDFPSYEENVYYYTYDNVAMICLNSNYWYSPSIRRVPEIGGNLHGYIMDNQLIWLESTLEMLESDENIDHVFVTLHTPIFPNGGHVGDDMWYNGDNSPRPYVAGKPVETGIIERRDQLLDLLMNHSTKVVATLTGDEHNYNRLRLTEDMTIYPDAYDGDRLSRFRPIWLINNGAAGAPYYGQEDTPWSSHLQAFSTQNALVLFHVDGKSISVEVINPDTMEPIDWFEI